ncbi:MAG: Flp pilus assembly complex ATPase component TadA [Candidatus Aenigmarchaeota archaeon]|nr:Flp pilus assembly complex ATPase component TadA [Candidatus Aenigmarchaeota archaeon]
MFGLRGALRKGKQGVPKEPKPEKMKGPRSYPIVFLKEPQKFTALPHAENISKTDVRYPILEPFVYAHVKWDDKEKKLVYRVLEPKLLPGDEDIMKKLEEDLIELIDVKLTLIKDRFKAMEYLHGRVQQILNENGIALPEDQYTRLMYFIVRDFIGLNEIEPLLHDPYIEDIGCTGLYTAVYIVHRRYGSIETNIIYNDPDYLSNFVVKMAERCGRYISYATPLLDGSLPDGSRVQASLAKDVTTKGPTFSIRRFRKNPYSPLDVVNLKTANIDMMAYLWVLMQYKTSVLICGGVSTGKCIGPDDYIQLGDGEIVSAEELHSRVIRTKRPCSLFTISNNPLKIEATPVNTFWRQESERLFSVKTQRGISVSVTTEHPFLCMKDGELRMVKAAELKEGDFVASARYIPVRGKKQPINMLEYDTRLYARGCHNLVRKMVKKSGRSRSDLINELGVNKYTFDEWFRHNSMPLVKLAQLARLVGVDPYHVARQVDILAAKTSKKNVKNITQSSLELAMIAGYVIGDGNIDKNCVNFHNSSRKLRRHFGRLVESTFGIKTYTMYPSRRTPREQIFSGVVAEIFGKAFSIPSRQKSRSVAIPSIIMKSTLKEVSGFISALYDCDSYVSRRECAIEFSTASEKMARQLPYLLQRFGICPRTRVKLVRGEKYYRVNIYGINDLKLFKEKIGYTHEDKKIALDRIIRKTAHYITNVDLLPVNPVIAGLCRQYCISNSALARHAGLKRESIRDIIKGNVRPQRPTVKKIARGLKRLGISDSRVKYLGHLSESDIFWDRVASIKEMSNEKRLVYDVTVDGTHNFVAGNFGGLIVSNTTFLNTLSMFIPPEEKIISIEDTREINLPHENWIPAVSRTGFGVPEASGKRYGEIDLFDLLKESFRQNPDYVIVGEIRGKEAYVMFQGMASGHASIGTIHAGSVDDVVKRLVTPPIELSPSLIESLDVIVVMTHSRERGQSARRVKEIAEVQSVDARTGVPHINKVFVWMPSVDEFKETVSESEVLRRISFKEGISYNTLLEEVKKRRHTLEWLERHKVFAYDEFSKLINLYYKDQGTIMHWVDNDLPPYSTKSEKYVEDVWKKTKRKIVIPDKVKAYIIEKPEPAEPPGEPPKPPQADESVRYTPPKDPSTYGITKRAGRKSPEEMLEAVVKKTGPNAAEQKENEKKPAHGRKAASKAGAAKKVKAGPAKAKPPPAKKKAAARKR